MLSSEAKCTRAQNATALMRTRALRFSTTACDWTRIFTDMVLMSGAQSAALYSREQFHSSRTPRKRDAGQLKR
jgi:hypothetical protein